jgi:hypothetical protein
VGDDVTLHGSLQQREHDNNANALWWVYPNPSPLIHGRARATRHQPFSYCEVDDAFSEDGCAEAPPPPPPPR